MFYDTTKHQIAEIMFNFAMRLCEDDQEEAEKLINQERELVKRKPARDLFFWRLWGK